MKTCTKCGRPKRPTDFGPDRRKRDGLQPQCRRCRADAQVARNARDPDARRAAGRQPEARQRRNERLRQRRRDDPAWREQMRQRAKTRHDRHAREGALAEEIGERDSWTCYLCGEHVARSAAHVDHVVALARGGTHALSNLAITHGDCNRRKRDRRVGQLAWVVPTAILVERRALAALGDALPPRRPRSPSRLAWQPEEDAVLTEMWATDESWVVLEHTVGRSVEAMRKRAYALGLPRRYRCFDGFTRRNGRTSALSLNALR